MASAKECDVCHKLYREECTPDITIEVYRHPYGANRVDLCPECQKKLEAFVKGDKNALDRK